MSIPQDKVSMPAFANEVGISLVSAHRWTQKGVNHVRLKSFLIGGRRYTRRVWIDEFLQAINGCDATIVAAPTAAQRESVVSANERELIEQGA